MYCHTFTYIKRSHYVIMTPEIKKFNIFHLMPHITNSKLSHLLLVTVTNVTTATVCCSRNCQILPWPAFMSLFQQDAGPSVILQQHYMSQASQHPHQEDLLLSSSFQKVFKISATCHNHTILPHGLVLKLNLCASV